MLTTWEASCLDTLENTNDTYYITVYAPNTETLTSENSLFKRSFYGGQSFTTGIDSVPGSIILDENVENNQTGDVNPTFHVPSISGYDSIDVKFTNMLTNENVEIKNVTLGETTTVEIALPSGSADFEVIVFGHKADSTVVIVSEIITISN